MTVSDKNVGVIGIGMMGGALAECMVNSGTISKERLSIFDIDKGKVESIGSKLNCNRAASIKEVVDWSDILIIAVKPQSMSEVLSEIGMWRHHLIVSIAAGIPTDVIEGELKEEPEPRVIRVMPNIACTVAASASAYCAGKHATIEDVEAVHEILSSAGIACEVPESLMDAVTGLSGGGIAFMCMIIEALADAGVYEGIDRRTAQMLAAQTVTGAGKLLLELGSNPEFVKDMVASPGGTTIRGIDVLEQYGVRGAMISAVKASAERSRELGLILRDKLEDED